MNGNMNISPEELVFLSKNFVSDFRNRNVAEHVNEGLRNLGKQYFERSRKFDLQNFIVDKIQLKKPFSAIRLGDGEGGILMAADPGNHKMLGDYSLFRILRHQFGRCRYSDSDIHSLLDNFVSAIKGSDLLGVPHISQINSALSRLDEGEFTQIRTMNGNLGVWYWLDNHYCMITSKKYFWGISFFHIQLGYCLEKILNVCDYVSAITCYPEFLDVLSRRYKIKKGILLTVPPHAYFLGGTPENAHFPDSYKEILLKLKRDLTGHTFLVGAGFLGKIYCAEIKCNGGIAIDIGSLIEALFGISNRNWHKPEIIEKLKIE